MQRTLLSLGYPRDAGMHPLHPLGRVCDEGSTFGPTKQAISLLAVQLRTYGNGQ